jgi:hypothetical protein
VKYINSVSDWPSNFPVAKRKDKDWNEMNEQSIRGNLPDIVGRP